MLSSTSAPASGDGYTYRYYVMGDYHKNTGTCRTPVNPLPGAEYFPFTPNCFKGCIPDGVDLGSVGFAGLQVCTETAQPGTVLAVDYADQDDFARCVRVFGPVVCVCVAFVHAVADATSPPPCRAFDFYLMVVWPSHDLMCPLAACRPSISRRRPSLRSATTLLRVRTPTLYSPPRSSLRQPRCRRRSQRCSPAIRRARRLFTPRQSPLRRRQ